MSDSPQHIFEDRLATKADCRLAERALRAGWLTPERRAGLQKKVWEVAEKCADSDDLKNFVACANLLEKSYEFDVKLAEREEERELKRGEKENERVQQVRPKVLEVTGEKLEGSFEQQRKELARRISGAGVGCGDSGGSGSSPATVD